MSQVFHFTVGPEDFGKRLDSFLFERLGQLSKIHIANLIGEGVCKVNQKDARARGLHLNKGDEIVFTIESVPHNAMTPEEIPLEITREDEAIIVVVKPSGMLVHPTLVAKSGTLLNALAFHLNQNSAGENVETNFIRPGLVHRLDRETSGLMVIAKTQEALSRLAEHFKRKLVEKRYLAIVEGLVGQDEIKITARIGRDESQTPKWRAMENGKEAETNLRVLERYEDKTLVELEPVTGRTNQLRIHCAFIGHPIIGDKLRAAPTQTRLCLHAARLAFFHPVTNEWMTFDSPLPEEIERLIKK
jgi:23S rRNA pseudouridine1911/1915/1917 synthase